tara:strand:- start:314 stop:697 length:384 start_codon:yes stop_codon:yes gene_type:complete
MSITNIDKNHMNQIIEIPNLDELNKDKIIKSVQKNSNNYAKIKVLFKQMENIKKEIEEIVEESLESENLNNIKCNFKKIPGSYYYVYQKPDLTLFFSILSPNEWNTKNIFINKYFYDYDLSLIKINL